MPLLSSVDLILMGHQGENSKALIGAIAIGAAVFNIIYWGFGFLRMGTTGLTAQAYGANNQQQIAKLFFQSGLIALVVGLLIIILQSPIGNFSFWLLDAQNQSGNWARQYFDIRIWAAPAVLLLYVLNGWFFGMQNAKYPTIIVVAINLFNIALNYYFVVIKGMMADGVALGTMISQYLGLALAFGLLLYKYTNYIKKYALLLQSTIAELKHFFSVNSDIFIRTLSLIVTFTFFTKASNTEGDLILSVNSVLLQLLYLMSYAVDGFAYASESLVGKYKGANNVDKLKKSVYYSFYWGMAFAAIFMLLYALFGKTFVSLFAESPDIVEQSQPFINWLILCVMFGAAAFIWDGVYIGATATKAMRNTMLMATFLVYFPAYYLFYPLIGNHALWLAMVLYMLSRTIGLTILSKWHIFGETT